MILEMYIQNTINDSFPASSNNFLTLFCFCMLPVMTHYFIISCNLSVLYKFIHLNTKLENMKTCIHITLQYTMQHYSTLHYTQIHSTSNRLENNYRKNNFAVRQKHEKTEKHAYILQYSTHHYTTVHYTTHNYIQHSATNKTVT